jgi:hypothetical protein
MRKLLWLPAIVFLLAATGGILNGAVFKNTAGGVSIWMPDDWEIDSDEEEGALYADAPEGDAFCVLQVLAEASDLKTALAAYRDALTEEMDEFAPTREGSQSQMNGLQALRISGKGIRDETAWSVDVLLISTAKAVLMCAIGWEKDKEGEFAPLRDKIFPSISKLD